MRKFTRSNKVRSACLRIHILRIPMKSLGTDGVNQCGSVQSSASCRYIYMCVYTYIVPVLLLPAAYISGL